MKTPDMEPENPGGDGIAIVGMSGRFPGASDVASFWANIRDGVESISHFSEDEMDVPRPTQIDEAEMSDTYVPAKGVLDDVDMFDARFFGYIPREAELMDPQHRVFLECAWEALEHAGYDPDRYPGLIGVYAGCYIDTYLLANLCSDPDFLRNLVDSIQVGSLQTELGNDKDYLATRVSFKMNLRGPSLTVQTACSTSLVAIAHACQSLATYQSDMVLAGGVTITFPQKKGYFYREGGMLSSDGHCRAFSDRAEGTVFSNGAGVIVLKRLADAIADDDTIYAVIRGWAINNDGGAKQSYTAPSVDGQAEVIAMAQAMADIDARTIGYVEAHGTATPLGDPIEVAGLTRAFRATTNDNGFCALGSVKTNLGHLDVASGVIGSIKTAMALHQGVLPPNLHFERPNPNIDFSQTPFYVNTKLRPWERQAWPRRAGVSSFGVGGTNAHLVLEETPARSVPVSVDDTYHVLPLSAKTPTALAAAAERLSGHLECNPDLALGDVARTLQIGRRVFDHRRYVVARDIRSAIEALRAEPSPATQTQQRRSNVPVSFVFSGQGAQYPNMLRGIYESDADVRESVDTCARLLLPALGFDLREVLFPPTDAAAECAERLRQTALAQPAIFTVEYALAHYWLRRGVTPDAMIGHSIGEFTAACVAGVMSLADALDLVATRGRLMQDLPAGAMISVRAPLAQVEALLTPGLSIAAVNAPSLCVVSGPDEQVPAFTAALDGSGIAHSRLHTSHAFHSAMMDAAVEPLIERVKAMKLSPPQIPIQSTVTAMELTPAEAMDPAYWGRQLRQTVRFAAAVENLAAGEPHVFLEVGPGQTLTTLIRQTLDAAQATAIPSLGPVQAPGEDAQHAASAAGRLWLSGANVDWTRLGTPTGRRVPLPTYAFERKRFWVDPPTARPAAAPVAAAAPEPAAVSNNGNSADSYSSNGASEDDAMKRLIDAQIALMRTQLTTLQDL